MVRRCRSQYKKELKLDYVVLEKKKKLITVCFKPKCNSIGDNLEVVERTEKVMYDTFFSSNRSKYEDYTINLHFRHIGDSLRMEKITKVCDEIEFYGNTYIQLKNIAKMFPDIKKLIVYSLDYDTIHDIDNFTSLRYFHIEDDILTEEDKAYITGKFPDCTIE